MQGNIIRQAKSGDLHQLRSISIKTFSQTYSSYNTIENLQVYMESSFSIERLSTELADEKSQFYFAEIDNSIVGYLKLNFGNAQTEIRDEKGVEIERIYVLKEFQGKQLGHNLFLKALEVALQNNAEYIWLGVWEKNYRAIRFYQKNGFTAFNKHCFLLGTDEQTDIMMKLELM